MIEVPEINSQLLMYTYILHDVRRGMQSGLFSVLNHCCCMPSHVLGALVLVV